MKRSLCALVIVFACVSAFASDMQDVLVSHEVTRLILELGIIILAAKAGGYVSRKLGLPGLLGEVGLGVLLSPYALGSVSFYGFKDGLFPLAAGAFPISIQLYGFAAVGAVIHVLAVGLETDIGLFARVRQRGFTVALSSSILSLAAGVIVGTVFFKFPIFDRRVFFLASLSVSTSLGVQARILHSQNKMDTPESGAIFSASLLQDGFAIIFLAIAMAVGTVELHQSPETSIWNAALPVTLLALAMLIGGTVLTFWAAPRLSRLFAKWTNGNIFVVLVIGLAMLLSGIFETFGVAAIIGAYIIGLAFARTDIGDILSEKTQPISEFFVPVLYVVMGMLVDYRVLFSPAILLPGIGFALLSAFAKIAGSFFPALGYGFTKWGALRVGIGTVPRGEVALIIAAVGLALGDFSSDLFKVMIVMIVFSVAIGAPAFALALKTKKSGTRGEWGNSETETTLIELPNAELSNLITDALVHVAENDGFFVHRLELSGTVYRLRKDEVYLTLWQYPKKIEITCAPQDVGIAKTFLYEVIVHVRDRVSRITEVNVPMELRRDIAAGVCRNTLNLGQYLFADRVVTRLSSGTSEGIITELVDALDRDGALLDRDTVLRDVLSREKSVSTGLEHGIAIPHGRSAGVRGVCLAAGVAPQGADFNALDGKPCTIIFLIVSETNEKGPHLQLLATLASTLRSESRRTAVLASQTQREFIAAMLQPERE